MATETIQQTPAPNAAQRMVLKGMALSQLESWAVSIGQPKYRGAQLFDWLYAKGAASPADMANLPKAFRAYLDEHCLLSAAQIVSQTASSQEPTVKYLLALNDGRQVETVSMLADGRHTVCLSSQVGCNGDCHFCATAAMGFVRNLTSGEMVDQLLLVQQARQLPATNVVFMGMGEPFFNYEPVLAAANIFHHPQALNLGARRITISTVGVIPKIDRFTEESRPYRLAISLNAPGDDVRTALMPLNQTWPLGELLPAVRRYTRRSQRRVTFEYVLMAGVNDQSTHARQLVKLLKGLHCKVNIIPFNETDGRYRRPGPAAIEAFAAAVSQGDFPVTVRWSNGADIAAGCGQLAVKQS